MATLKMYNERMFHMWLPGVRTITQVCYFEVKDALAGESPWAFARRKLEEWQKEAKTSDAAKFYDRVLWSLNYNDGAKPDMHGENRSSLEELPSDKDQNLSLLRVEVDGPHGFMYQNWLVWADFNYLLENGKTVDKL